MELHLDPIIPVTRVVNGHNVFNKGYRHGLRGKTYEEYLKGRIRQPKNGWQWFYENESYKWCDLINK